MPSEKAMEIAIEAHARQCGCDVHRLAIVTLAERIDALLASEREWMRDAMREAERRLRETPECGASLVEDAWPFMDILGELLAARGEGEGT